MASAAADNALGAYLKARRARLDPAAFGFPATRRRTPGLRREEVASRAHVSATWYTWLEQGRGGAPSADVLDRLSRALALSEVEREHLFLLAQRRPPEVVYRPSEPLPASLQPVLDALELCPALVKNVRWDVVAWNRAAAAVLTDWAPLAPEDRNVLRRLFGGNGLHAKVPHWESHARAAVATFRLGIARVGAEEDARDLIEELSATSADFRRLWASNEVDRDQEGTKLIDHPSAGALALRYAGFTVEGRPDLGLIIYTPADGDTAGRVRALLAVE